MLRGKAYKYRTQGARFRDRMLSGTDRMGRLIAIPMVAQAVNKVNATPVARSAMEKTLGVAAQANLPPYASRTFRRDASRSVAWPVRDGARTPGKVAVFSTCYVNYNDPDIGRDLLAVLDHNEIRYEVVAKEVCCGMPKLELGDFESVERFKNVNIPELAPLARDGYAILTPVPSCTLMFKHELPLIFPEDADVKRVSDAMFDPFEYFVLRDKDGLLKKDFVRALGNVSYHIPCHQRVQNIGQRTREALQAVPGTTVHTVERCAGHDGTYGVKREFYANSMKIGRPVFRQMAEPKPDYVSSDCPIAGRRIEHAIGRAGDSEPSRCHPLTLLRIAYGIE
jgi:Fe-S oxidoreductase